MENHNEHTMHAIHNMVMHNRQEEKSTFILALSATIHCLIGCGIGEVVGMIIGTALNMSMIDTTILSVILGFIAGLSLGVVPLLRAKFTFRKALKTVLIAEGLSI